ncbi:MAG: hypothetical protein ACKOPQ_13165 [Novosphingobium sp.]
MGLDIIARAAAKAARQNADLAAGAASAAQSAAGAASLSASQAQARAVPSDLFVNLGTITIDPAVTSIISSGYSALGKGIGIYVSDSLATAALAAAHPRFCKATANGRYFRLVPDSPEKAISVAHGGATGGSGINEQPAIQATVAYASATACRWVDFPESAYELWCPIRTSSYSAVALDGHPIVITSTTGLGLRGCRAGTTLNLKNSLGGSKNTITQVVTGQNWQGGGIFVFPGGVWPSPAIEWVAIENLIVDGGVTFNPADRSNLALNDKGLRIQDITCNRVHVRNSTFMNFAGEIYYVGGSTVSSQLLENVTLDGSPQSSLNPSSSGKFVGINVQAGNSYQACEVLGAQSFTMIGGRLYDCYSASMAGGPDGPIPAGYPFIYPTRQTTKRPPWITLIGTRLEGFTDSIQFGSWVHGTITTVDCAVTLPGNNRDVFLNIEAWNDQKSAFSAVRLGGPATLTTQMAGAPAGVYVTPTNNVTINIQTRRTQLAQANSRYFSAAVQFYGGLIDKNTVLLNVSGEAAAVFVTNANPAAGFGFPRIDVSGFKTIGQPYGGTFDFPTGDKTYDVAWSAIAIVPPAGTMNVTLGNTYGYCDGQKVIFYHKEATAGKVLNFPADGAGLKLQRDRKLFQIGDLLELRYDATISKWVEERYVTATRQTFTGTAAYDAPDIPAGGATTVTVTATGCALGDSVTSVTLDTNLLGLIASGYVSAANTVTVVLFNPTAAAINLPAANVSVSVQKK